MGNRLGFRGSAGRFVTILIVERTCLRGVDFRAARGGFVMAAPATATAATATATRLTAICVESVVGGFRCRRIRKRC